MQDAAHLLDHRTAEPGPPPDPTRDADPRETRILEAARDVIMEHGYAGAAMDLVASRAKVSKTTLYTRFPSKEALFAATVTAVCTKRGMRFTPAEFAGLPIDEALTRIGRRFLDLLHSPEAVRVHQIIIGEAQQFPEVARIFYEAGPAQARAALAAYLADATARGLLALDDPGFAAGALLIALKGALGSELELGLRPPPDLDEREVLIARTVRLFLDGARPR